MRLREREGKEKGVKERKRSKRDREGWGVG